MEVLACIPALSTSIAPVTAVGGHGDSPATVEPAAVEVVAATGVAPARKVAPVRDHVRARPTHVSGVLSPSMLALAAVAAVIWAAAWRNDHARLEAARLQRPERLAQELPPTAGGERSRTP